MCLHPRPVRLPGQKARPYLQNNQRKKDWRHGSSGRVAASKTKGPEFSPQYHKNKSVSFIDSM
jgi:hypothetical protein